jgi:anaerobic magnesium-protoporphyrin IX monomethyl ester cyclase
MILLFNPRSARWKHRLPLSLLSLGAVLEGTYDYEIVDGNFETDAPRSLAARIREKGIRYFGVTVMPGPQLVEAITVTRALKQQFPDLVVIWGGYFPSLHADAVLKSGFVDHVIRGPGEAAFFELINKLENRPARTPTHQALQDMPLPYHRMDVDRYVGKTCLGSRTVSYHSSFGCPFLCGFCAVAAIYKGRWTGKPADVVAHDVLWFRDKHGVNAVEFVDNNFFVAEHRTREIAERLRGKGITWWGEARPDTLLEFSDSTWRAMREGGCKMIFFGAESSSDDVLARMDKGGTQTSDTVLRLAERMREIGIIPEFSFVLGTPASDVEAQIERDIQYIRRIKAINPQSEIVIYVYSPVAFDDAGLLQQARQFGFEFPKQLVDWLDPVWQNFDLRKNPHTPWLLPRHVERIMNFERVLNARFPTVSDIKLKRWQTTILRTIGAWRYKLGFYTAPWEIRLVANRLFRYRQPEIEGF